MIEFLKSNKVMMRGVLLSMSRKISQLYLAAPETLSVFKSKTRTCLLKLRGKYTRVSF
jgi:hypothetical protein